MSLINFKEQSPETPRILWNPELHYRIHNSLSPVLILNQINPVFNPYAIS